MADREKKALKKLTRVRRRHAKKVEGPKAESLKRGIRSSYALGKQEKGKESQAKPGEKYKSRERVYTIGRIEPEKRAEEKHSGTPPTKKPELEVVTHKTAVESEPGGKAVPRDHKGTTTYSGSMEKGPEEYKTKALDEEKPETIKHTARGASTTEAERRKFHAYQKTTGIEAPDEKMTVRRKGTKGKGFKHKKVVKSYGPKTPKAERSRITVTGKGSIKDPEVTTKQKGRKVITITKGDKKRKKIPRAARIFKYR